MILGKVVGTVWCTRKHPRLGGIKLLLIEPYFLYELGHDGEHIVAVDTMEAGVGDDVVICLGMPARRMLGDDNYPVEAAVMAIVDQTQLRADEFGAEQDRPLAALHPLNPALVEWI